MVKKCRRCKCAWYYAGKKNSRKVWKCAHCPAYTHKTPKGVY